MVFESLQPALVPIPVRRDLGSSLWSMLLACAGLIGPTIAPTCRSSKLPYLLRKMFQFPLLYQIRVQDRVCQDTPSSVFRLSWSRDLRHGQPTALSTGLAITLISAPSTSAV